MDYSKARKLLRIFRVERVISLAFGLVDAGGLLTDFKGFSSNHSLPSDTGQAINDFQRDQKYPKIICLQPIFFLHNYTVQSFSLVDTLTEIKLCFPSGT